MGRFDKGRSPPVPEGWKSAHQLERLGYIGGRNVIHRKMNDLRAELIREGEANGLTQGDATFSVENHFVGTKRSMAGGPETLYASPRAISMLDLERKNQPKSRAKLEQETWQSGTDLERTHKAGSRTINRKLKELRLSLFKDMILGGIDKDTADSVIEQNFVNGIKKRFDNGPVIYGSPAAIRLLEDQGILKRRRWTEKIWNENIEASAQKNKEDPSR